MARESSGRDGSCRARSAPGRSAQPAPAERRLWSASRAGSTPWRGSPSRPRGRAAASAARWRAGCACPTAARDTGPAGGSRVRARQPGGREVLHTFAQPGARDRQRVDRIRLPARAWLHGERRPSTAPADARQSRPGRSRTAPGSGDIADIFDRPYPLDIERRGPTPTAARSRPAGPARCGARPRRRAASTAAAVWVCLCGSTPIVTICLSLPRLNPMKRTSWRTFLSRGAATLLSGHARTSLTATGDNFTNRSAPRGATKAERVSPKPSRTIHYTRQKRNAPPASH